MKTLILHNSSKATENFLYLLRQIGTPFYSYSVDDRVPPKLPLSVDKIVCFYYDKPKADWVESFLYSCKDIMIYNYSARFFYDRLYFSVCSDMTPRVYQKDSLIKPPFVVRKKFGQGNSSKPYVIYFEKELDVLDYTDYYKIEFIQAQDLRTGLYTTGRSAHVGDYSNIYSIWSGKKWNTNLWVNNITKFKVCPQTYPNSLFSIDSISNTLRDIALSVGLDFGGFDFSIVSNKVIIWEAAATLAFELPGGNFYSSYDSCDNIAKEVIDRFRKTIL